MLRFFRQIRQRLLADNKFSKYLLYAVGEILLVVIGILIALQVNNWNEERKNEEKTRTILSDLMVELASDIEKSTQLMMYYAGRDSTFFLVLNDRVTKEDYEKNEIPHLHSITSWRTSFSPTDNAYEILTQNIDLIPLKYKSLLKDLSALYNHHKIIEEQNNGIRDFFKDKDLFQSQNFAWYASNSAEDQKSKIEYMLNDFRYKNTVSRYKSAAIDNQLRWAIIYRQKAIETYIKIAELLDKSVYDDNYVFDQEKSKILIGNWEVVGEPDTKISFIRDGKRMYFKDNVYPDRKEVFWLPPSKILLDNQLYGTLIIEGEEDLIKFNSFDLKRVD